MIGLRKLWRCESGATLVEYSLVIALIAVVIVVAGRQFGAALHSMYQQIAATLSSA